MAITIKSRKAKGRKFQQWIATKISDITGIKSGKDELIESREMGQSGVDIKLYGKALELFPFSIEAKRCERVSLPTWIKQAKQNLTEGTSWLLFFKRSREDPVVIMDADYFFELYGELIDWRRKYE